MLFMLSFLASYFVYFNNYLEFKVKRLTKPQLRFSNYIKILLVYSVVDHELSTSLNLFTQLFPTEAYFFSEYLNDNKTAVKWVETLTLLQ